MIWQKGQDSFIVGRGIGVVGVGSAGQEIGRSKIWKGINVMVSMEL